ncbi:MAG TPA: type II toxin-antitoxin system ParD family antitoxin [Rhodospirillaceae bacterium]|nr:type II toxin-antitoxin system ParD family antitoxin [Rhodospirillaceae bacterium]
MSKNTSIALGGHFADFISSQVDAGRYASASEVIRAGLRLLEEREAQLSTLRAALIEGEQSGPAEPFDFDAMIAAKKQPGT